MAVSAERDAVTGALALEHRLAIVDGLLSSLGSGSLALRSATTFLHDKKTPDLTLQEARDELKAEQARLCEALKGAPLRATAGKKGSFHGMHGRQKAAAGRSMLPDGEEHEMHDQVTPAEASAHEKLRGRKPREDAVVVEADAKGDFPLSGLPAKDWKPPTARHRKRKKKSAPKLEEMTYSGNPQVRTPWGGAVPGVIQQQQDGVEQLVPDHSVPPGLREADPDSFRACASCVHFAGAQCNLYGVGREGGEDIVHEGGYPVEAGDVCDSWETLIPSELHRIAEAAWREWTALGIAERAEHGSMVVRRRARVEIAEARLEAALEEFSLRLHVPWAETKHRRSHGKFASKGGIPEAPKVGPMGRHIPRQRREMPSGVVQHESHELIRFDQATKMWRLFVDGKPQGAGHRTREQAEAAMKDLVKRRRSIQHAAYDEEPARAFTQWSKPETRSPARALSEVSSSSYPDLGRTGRKNANWVSKQGGLPRYIERVAKHVHYENGKSISRSIQIAVGVVRRWCEGGGASARGGVKVGSGGVKPGTKAKACAAIAQWDAMRATSKASTAAKKVAEAWTFDEIGMPEALRLLEADTRIIPPSANYAAKVLAELGPELDMLDELEVQESVLHRLFNPLLHPHTPKGRKGGGQWAETITGDHAYNTLGGKSRKVSASARAAEPLFYDWLDRQAAKPLLRAKQLGAESRAWQKAHPKTLPKPLPTKPANPAAAKPRTDAVLGHLASSLSRPPQDFTPEKGHLFQDDWYLKAFNLDGRANPPAGPPGAAQIAKAVKVAADSGVDVKLAFAPADAGPLNPTRSEYRMRAAAAILDAHAEIPDAILHLPDESKARDALIAKITTGDVKRAQHEFRDAPLGDLEVLGGVDVKPYPIPERGSAEMSSRRLRFGAAPQTMTGDFRHELGHALRAAWSGEGAPYAHTPLTEQASLRHQEALAKVQANIAAGKPKPQSEPEWEKVVGIGSPRALDNWEEDFAEAYRTYRRQVFRQTHKGDPDYDPQAMAKYRELHPAWTRMWDAWYTAQVAGRGGSTTGRANPAAGRSEEDLIQQLHAKDAASPKPESRLRRVEDLLGQIGMVLSSGNAPGPYLDAGRHNPAAGVFAPGRTVSMGELFGSLGRAKPGAYPVLGPGVESKPGRANPAAGAALSGLEIDAVIGQALEPFTAKGDLKDWDVVKNEKGVYELTVVRTNGEQHVFNIHPDGKIELASAKHHVGDKSKQERIKALAAKIPEGGWSAMEADKSGEAYAALDELEKLPDEDYKLLSKADLTRVYETSEDVNWHTVAGKAWAVLQGKEFQASASLAALPTTKQGGYVATGGSETVYHMNNGQIYKGEDGHWYQKITNTKMNSKKGMIVASEILNLDTGTTKTAPAFALHGHYYDLYEPAGSGALSKSKVTTSPVQPAHGGPGKVVFDKPPPGGWTDADKVPKPDDVFALLKKSVAAGGAAGQGSNLPVSHNGGIDSVAGMHVVITGKLDETRKAVEAKLTAAGAIVHSSVTNQVDLLILGDNVGAKKIGDAQKKGVKAVPYLDVKHLLEAELGSDVCRLIEVGVAIEEAASSAEIVRLRARQGVLLRRLDERFYSAAQRREMAAQGLALKDGSFPIKDKVDLKNAVRLLHHGKDKAAAARHITKRAAALGVKAKL